MVAIGGKHGLPLTEARSVFDMPQQVFNAIVAAHNANEQAEADVKQPGTVVLRADGLVEEYN